MRLLVCGNRDWTERERTQREIAALVPDVLIHGGAGQRDRLTKEPLTSDILFAHLARQWARQCGHPLEFLLYPADWRLLGRKAGPIRNARMLVEGKPDRGLAFGALWRWDATAPSRYPRQPWKRTGTGDMVKRLLDANLPVRWVAAPDAPAVDLVTMPQPGGAS